MLCKCLFGVLFWLMVMGVVFWSVGSVFWLFAPCRVRVAAEEVLSDVHLLEKKHMLAGALSHGEQQRLELGIVLAIGGVVLINLG